MVDLRDFETPKYRFEPHRFKPHAPSIKGVSWLVCVECGLVLFRNPLTEWAVSKGCWADAHPDYKTVSKRLGRSGAIGRA